ncbi:POX domain [Dillenia turbinata]|uniref:POX domain n=1 Tax=Dillenia turbinata TaxID=194707 RepID=A0AAN8WBY5_9MAGN
MAEGFEPYHVPQQSRREKLRILQQQQQLEEPTSTTSQSLPLYDPSLICSDLLSCHPHHQHPLSPNVVKEENVANFMGFFGSSLDPSSSSSSSAHNNHHHHPYLDPVNINPSSIQDINNNHFLYDSHLIFKPEPLSLTHETNSTTTGGGQGLSLSLSSPHSIPLELNLQRYDSAAAINFHHQKFLGGSYVVQGGNMVVGGGSGGGSTSSVPLGPFTGYASILKGSRFLKPAQQLLDEFCNVGSNVGVCPDKFAEDHAVLMDPTLENLDGSLGCGDAGGENRGKKSRLISMLDEVYKRYKQYYQQMQAVLHSFESVAGLSNAAPYAHLALKLMSKQFRCLKASITDQLQLNNKIHGHLSYGKDETPRPYGNDKGLYGQRRVHSSGGYFDQQPVWRPQRGLPERAVTVLRAWLFEHFLHPYPTDTDKLMLAKQTGLTRSQVSNWFINARVRLWKPMVEEIHLLETRQAQKASQKDERNVNRPSENIPTSNLHAPENSSTSNQRVQDPPPKRTRNEIPIIPVNGDETMDMSYNHLSSHQHLGVGVGTAGGSSNVSLTLGLHQNNGIGSLEPFPISAAHRFGLDSSEGIVMGGFEAQNRHFGRDIIGGQLLHDFVG